MMLLLKKIKIDLSSKNLLNTKSYILNKIVCLIKVPNLKLFKKELFIEVHSSHP